VDRISIGKRFYSLPAWRRYVGSMLIFLPIVASLPFVAVGAWILYAHLRVLGAKNLKGFRDFVPEWSSHRYAKLSDHITFSMDRTAPWSNLKAFWMFNCNIYCPVAVGLYEWSAYLVKAVENFWCPFHHNLKSTYSDVPLDQSYWHIRPEVRATLHPEDRDCPIWNEDAEA
jgi:hypothetical protein